MFDEKIRRSAWGLSLSGLIPFIWCAGEVMFGTTFIHASPELILHCYAAIILSFLGGIMWAYGLTLQGNAQLTRWLLIIAVAPSLAGLFALLLPDRNASYIVLILAFATWTGAESALLEMQIMPDWFFRLRVRISCAVISILSLSWLAG